MFAPNPSALPGDRVVETGMWAFQLNGRIPLLILPCELRTTLTLLLTLTAATSTWAVPATNVPFRVGEKLTYRIYWGPFVGGQATLEVANIEPIDGHDCYHLIARAETTGFADFLFHVESRSESWLDVTELCTRRYRQARTEGKRYRADDDWFDYANHQLQTTNFVNGKVHSYPLTAPALDMISCLYFVRTKPLQLDVAEKIPVMLGTTRYEVTAKPDERKPMTFRSIGTVQALRIEPDPTIGVVARNDGRMWFWISDDARKLILLISSDMKIGSAKLVLSQYEPGKGP